MRAFQRIFIVITLGLNYSSSTLAEYRAFLLKITTPQVPNSSPEKKTDSDLSQQANQKQTDLNQTESANSLKDQNPNQITYVKSSLDPIQYRGYYHVSEKAIITYEDTWRCKGRTGGLEPICKSPKEIAKEKESQDQKPKTESPERTPANN